MTKLRLRSARLKRKLSRIPYEEFGLTEAIPEIRKAANVLGAGSKRRRRICTNTIKIDERPKLTVINLDEIRRNAKEQGIEIGEIALLYSDLDESEIRILEGMNLIARKSEIGVIGKFLANGEVMFPEKVTGVHYLGA